MDKLTGSCSFRTYGEDILVIHNCCEDEPTISYSNESDSDSDTEMYDPPMVNHKRKHECDMCSFKTIHSNYLNIHRQSHVKRDKILYMSTLAYSSLIIDECYKVNKCIYKFIYNYLFNYHFYFLIYLF